MFATKHTTGETEVLHWLLWIVAAIAILLALATALAADPMGPQILPERIDLPAGPMPRAFFPENPPLPAGLAVETSERLWMILEHQRAGCYAEALAAWEETQMPTETAVWKEIGMAAAWLALDDPPQALRRLEFAEQLAHYHPDPVVAYVRGLVWMRQVERLGQPAGDRELEGATAAEQRAVLELMAIADLEEAVEQAGLIDMAELLVTIPLVNGEPMVAPQVGDLLAALGVDRFADDARRHLFRLHLQRREFTEAEQHLEVALDAGVAGTPEMRELAAGLLDDGENAAAIRIMNGVVQRDYPGVVRIQQWLTAGPAQWLW